MPGWFAAGRVAPAASGLAARQSRRGQLAGAALPSSSALCRRAARGAMPRALLDDAGRAGRAFRGLRRDRCGAARSASRIRRSSTGFHAFLGALGHPRLARDLCPPGARAAAGAGLRPRPREAAPRRAPPRTSPTSRPRPGRAVSRAAAGPIKDKLLAAAGVSVRRAGCRRTTINCRRPRLLTGLFPRAPRVLRRTNKPLPPARSRFMETLQR